MQGASGYQRDRIARDTSAHPRYHFFGHADNLIAGDGKFFDRSGMENHGIRGAHLSDANMFATANHVSTLNPATSTEDSVIRIPNLNPDYAGGEKFIFFWKGQCTAETDVGVFGDGGNTTYPGIEVRSKAGGKCQLVARGATISAFSGSTTATPFDGNTHSVGILIDGTNRQYGIWVDGAVDIAVQTLDSSKAADTPNANTFNIGSVYPAAAVSTIGQVVKTRAFHLLRLSASDAVPTQGELTDVFKALHANHSVPVLGRAF